MVRKLVYVHPFTASLGPSLLEALERLAPVRFERSSDLANLREGDVVIDASHDEEVSRALGRLPVHAFHLKHAAGSRGSDRGETVRFAECKYLDPLFRGKAIGHCTVPHTPALEQPSDHEVLASIGRNPVWVCRHKSGGYADHVLTVALPRLREKEQLFDYLSGYSFMQLLPVVHFLRDVSGECNWTRPALRACVMFDDPNLHWGSYGFIRFQNILHEAKKENFHVTFATVPLDAWRPHSPTAALFRKNTSRLSLLFHGNDHTRNELAIPRSSAAWLRVLGQSVARIVKFEQATGLHVDRVMVPPHEALSADAASAFLALGFEGAVLTLWSLRSWNATHSWPITLGLEPAEMLPQGFPVVHRYQLSEDCLGPVLISAFLGSPVVLSGHHDALASGINLLAVVARTVNGLGDVRWCNAEPMLRSSYLLRKDGTNLKVQPVLVPNPSTRSRGGFVPTGDLHRWGPAPRKDLDGQARRGAGSSRHH